MTYFSQRLAGGVTVGVDIAQSLFLLTLPETILNRADCFQGRWRQGNPPRRPVRLPWVHPNQLAPRGLTPVADSRDRQARAELEDRQRFASGLPEPRDEPALLFLVPGRQPVVVLEHED